MNEEIKRRTKVARIFPSFESYERLAGTILVHIDEGWQEINNRYVYRDLFHEAIERAKGAVDHDKSAPPHPDEQYNTLEHQAVSDKRNGGPNFAETI